MLADLHIHSKYSSHALYAQNPEILSKITTIYPPSELLSEKPPFLSRLLIDGTSHIKNILSIAVKRGLGAIAITDHNTTIGSLEAQRFANKYGIIVVPAMELSTDSGELLAYGITSKIQKNLPIKQAIDLIHEQGGIAVAAHPFNKKHPNLDFSRIDEDIIKKLNIDVLEVFDVLHGRVDAHFLDLAKQMDIGITGGSDAHIHYQIGKGLTILPDSCVTWQDIIEAIKNKDSYATGLRLSMARIAVDMLWCQTLGRYFISKKWVSE